MQRVTILGSGAAPGVPSVSCGWGDCNPNNPKNRRLRAGTYLEFEKTKILVDTSPDLRLHLINNNIRKVDAVLITHAHADHLHGIDDLREINRVTMKPIDFYATPETMQIVKERFLYMFPHEGKKLCPLKYPTIIPHQVEYNQKFYVGKVSVEPIRLSGHNLPSAGYVFNDGKVVLIADFEEMCPEDVEKLSGKIELLIMPLTTPHKVRNHAGLKTVLEYVKKLKPQKTVLTHMATECDYDEINAKTPDNVIVGYDGLKIDLKG